MQKLTGVHFYINICNFDQIILDEENRTGKITYALHALDTYFSSIENFGKKASKNLVIEKITGSRLHLYVVDAPLSAFRIVKDVSVYAYRLSKYITTEILKYKPLKDFYINVGAAYGKFYDFEFTTREGFSELTTIGYAANFAAKLQSFSGRSNISISEDIYDVLSSDEKKLYVKIEEPSIEKYGQDKYYKTYLYKIASSIPITDADLAAAKSYANSDNLGDINFANVRAPLNFQALSKTQCKKLEGIPVFADIRGFTSQFEEDDSNLEEMAQKTQRILNAMYRASTEHGGIHVQFQGDRELSLYHNVPGSIIDGKSEKKCFKAAVLAAMRMIDAVKPFNVHIGVGEAFGELFATKIGARGEKDNILLGRTIIVADSMEDKNAREDQIAITNEVYYGLQTEDKDLARQFKRVGDYFITTVGYQRYQSNVAYKLQHDNTTRNNYNGAWGDLK